MTEIWLVAQALILCGLPYEEVADTQWQRKARLADGSMLKVTFASTEKGVPIPYGQDRGPLYFLVDRALSERRKIQKRIRDDKSLRITDDLSEDERDKRMRERARLLDGARFVEWTAASQFLDLMGKNVGGNQYALLKERMNRITACAISIVREKPDGEKETLVLPIVRSSRTPGWAKSSNKSLRANNGDGSEMSSSDSRPIGFEIGPDFFHDFVEHHVPIPAVLIKKLLRKPKTLDLVMWLCWRAYAANTDTFIPISDLREQLGTTDTNDGRVLAELRKAIEFLKQAGWSQLRAEVVSRRSGKAKAGESNRNGLRIGPPKDLVYFNQENEKAPKLHLPAEPNHTFDS
ncbi:replication protein RepA [Edaphobacter modestus]|nr:replication protein RepA [Edaphobacter modestus]